MLTGHGKQVALIVLMHAAAAGYQIQTVVAVAVVIDRHRPGNGGSVALRHVLQPHQAQTIGFGLLGGGHGKAGGKHLRQQDQISLIKRCDMLGKGRQIRSTVMPDQRLLQQRQPQIAHSSSPPRASVAASLAKQNRSTL
jgi:hypothetical protein